MVGRKDLHDKQKLYKRLKRKNESEEQRTNRLEKRRNYDCFKRANESEFENSSRLTKRRNYDCFKRANESALVKSSRLAKLRNFALMKKLNETPQEKSQQLERRRLKRVTESTAKKLVRLAKQKNNERISETADKKCHRQMQKLIMYMESTRHFGSAIKLRCSCLWNNEEQKAVKNSIGERSSQKVKKQRRQQRKSATCNKETIGYYHKVARDNEICTGSNVLSMDAIKKELDTFYGYSLSGSNTECE